MQIDIETLCDAAQHLPGYAPWVTTVGAAIEEMIRRQARGEVFLSVDDVVRLRRRLYVWGFTREMTLSEARQHAKPTSFADHG